MPEMEIGGEPGLHDATMIPAVSAAARPISRADIRSHRHTHGSPGCRIGGMVVSVVPSRLVMCREPSGSMPSRIVGSWAARGGWYLALSPHGVGVAVAP